MEYSKEYNPAILLNFRELIGNFITVFIDGGGKIGRGVAGTLIEANCGYIVLIQFCKKINYCKKRKFCRTANRKSNQKKSIVIPINKVVAIQHENIKFNEIREDSTIRKTKPDFTKQLLFLFALYFNIMTKRK